MVVIAPWGLFEFLCLLESIQGTLLGRLLRHRRNIMCVLRVNRLLQQSPRVQRLGTMKALLRFLLLLAVVLVKFAKG